MKHACFLSAILKFFQGVLWDISWTNRSCGYSRKLFLGPSDGLGGHIVFLYFFFVFCFLFFFLLSFFLENVVMV